MEETIKRLLFHEEDLERFCKLTCDTNKLHNPEYMRTIRKKPIVPGMMLLMSSFGSFYYGSEKGVEVDFVNPLQVEEEAKLTRISNPEGVNFRVENGSLILKGKRDISTLSLKPFISQGYSYSLPDYEHFADFFHGTPKEAKAFYAFSNISGVLFDLLKNPSTPEQRNLSERVRGESYLFILR